MKNLFLSLAVLFATASASYAQTGQPLTGGAKITIDKEVHDYGTIKQNANGACEFLVTNTGSEPLIISNAKGSCGCTVPEWPKAPILPGKSATMTVRYDTKRVGPINKNVTITSNDSGNENIVVRIKGNVLASENGSDMPVKIAPGAPAAN